MLGFSPDAIIYHGQVWRLITWVFIPANSGLIFTVIAFYFYYFIGNTLEQEWGTPKFTIYYLFGVALNIIFGFVMRYGFGVIDAILSPIYLNLSMFFAFAALFPDNVVRLFFIIPIKIKWLALANAAFFAYSIIMEIITGSVLLALLPLVAILNFIIICGGDVLSSLRPFMARNSPRTIKFRTAARKSKRDINDALYRHKCAVCGKTDTDDPNLEFRYCSRCDGYHCFCIEHINNHVHFQ